MSKDKSQNEIFERKLQLKHECFGPSSGVGQEIITISVFWQ